MPDMIKIIDLKDSFEWDYFVCSFQNHDIYYLNGYVKGFALHGDGEPKLLYYEANNLRAIYVYNLRPLGSGWFDIITPYGYGGILFDGDISESNKQSFEAAFETFMKDNNIICNFVRYHPLLQNANDMRSLTQVIDLGKTIAIDLSSEDIIWNNITSKNRNMIRKAEKNGVTIEHSHDLAIFDDFIRIYNETMDNDNADDYYYFNDSFYESIHKDLNKNYEMFYACYQGKIIAMSIILYCNGMMHYHLSGSLFEFRNLAPTNLLLYKAACWGCKQGFRIFHLGGGFGSGEDNLFKFKAAFNRNSGIQFSIGKQIFNQYMYEKLVNIRINEDSSFDTDSRFFPLYRHKISIKQLQTIRAELMLYTQSKKILSMSKIENRN